MSRSIIAVIVIAALLGGGVSHALVPHQHSHSHTEGETTIWAALHSSLRHEDKKMMLSIVESAVLFVLALVIFSSALVVSHQARTVRAEKRDVHARDALRRGIYRYRAFG